jgi:hypothetical protein
MKTVYVAYAMTHGTEPLGEVVDLAHWLKAKRLRVLQPSYHLFADDLAASALKAVDESDVVIADVSCRSHGVGFEIGYAFAARKEVILIARQSAKAQVSKFLSGLFPRIIFYSEAKELIQQVADFLGEPRGRKRITGSSDCSRRSKRVVEIS